ncbi:GNAT family N-acetyltransferase [uncultured Tenacibaculum sp.]|uniref:GNAT family N-acetyltransferase n=1 Tax=uncultured Tenacibaculum sp. TaxID=174713 RepID=UPI00260FA178|nr:GNAT family N-acetyltransferase [uncultured Tenacibaculum sp.]
MRLESERLIIKDAEVSEAPFYFELFNDPDWIKYIHDKGLKSVEATEAYLNDILAKNAKLNGLGFFSVLLKETNEFIGMTSAIQREKLDFVDVGYGFLPKGRGKGYASEATLLMIDYIKEKFKQEKVLAFTVPGNEKSQQLLERLGFKYVGLETIFEGEEDCVYEFKF